MTTAEPTASPVDSLAADLLETWVAPDPARRRAVAERIWAPDGRLVVAPAGIVAEGIDAIDAHTTRVHDERITGQGMRFAYDRAVESEQLVLLRWSMLAPDATVVARGVDVVRRTADGRVASVHMFMGVD